MSPDGKLCTLTAPHLAAGLTKQKTENSLCQSSKFQGSFPLLLM